MTEINMTVFGAAFAIYTLAIVGVGVYSSRFAKRSDEDYFLAGRSLGSWIAALSASASSESGWVTLGLVGWAFASGVSAYWIIPGCLLGFMFNWFILAGPMRDRAGELDALTLPDLFAFHFRERIPIIRILSVIVILVAMLLYVAAQFAAAGKAFEAAFGMNYGWGVLTGAVIVLIYTVSGGFRAVCWTDSLQALLMVGALVVFPIFLLLDLGGFDALTSDLRGGDPEFLKFIPSSAHASALAFAGFLFGSGALGINFGYPGQPHVLVRYMALRSRKAAIAGGFIAVIWGGLVYWGAVTTGLLARAMTIEGAEWTAPLLAEGGNEMGLVLAAKHLLPAVMSGLVLAAVLAAICSTADSQLVVAASSAANDLYSRLVHRTGELSHMLINRLTVFGLGVIAVLLVFENKVQVYTYVLTYGWAILGAAFGPQVILLLFWKRATWIGAIAGMLTGFIVAVGWQLAAKASDDDAARIFDIIYNLPLAFIGALVVNVVVSLFTKPPESD